MISRFQSRHSPFWDIDLDSLVMEDISGQVAWLALVAAQMLGRSFLLTGVSTPSLVRLLQSWELVTEWGWEHLAWDTPPIHNEVLAFEVTILVGPWRPFYTNVHHNQHPIWEGVGDKDGLHAFSITLPYSVTLNKHWLGRRSHVLVIPIWLLTRHSFMVWLLLFPAAPARSHP